MWNGSPCDRHGSDYATANGLASPNDEYEYSAPLHTALAPEVNFLGIHGWGSPWPVPGHGTVTTAFPAGRGPQGPAGGWTKPAQTSNF